MKRSRLKVMLCLHIMLVLYSFSSILSKLAARQQFFSWNFCIYYALIILLLALYAIGWQQVIKRLPLSVAFANKAITIVWGIIWGFPFFDEKVTLGKLIGAVMVIIGIVLYAKEDEKD